MSEPGGASSIDALVERFVVDVRAGRNPSVDAIVAAHPELGDELRLVLSAAATVERIAKGHETEVDSFPGLEILREIAPGIGGMGRVYAARETTLDRVVAVKTTREHMRTPEGRDFFLREARAAASLDHQNVVKVFSFDPDHSPPYYVMQYVEGLPLDEACRGRDVVLIARIVEQVARGLAFAHERGIVHRDIKPANVLVSADGVPHITDFGLAKPVCDAVDGPPGASTMKGTPRYIAPEVYAGAAEPGPSVDIYALGITLYELICGRAAFPDDGLAELRAAVLGTEPELPQRLAPHIPESLQRICLMAIEKDPDDRYASALEMADDLGRFCTGTPVQARPKRYERAVRGRMYTHITEIRSWREQKLISVTIMDRLVRPYHLTLQDDSAWERLARRHPVESTALRLAGIVLLVSSILWPVFYWERLGSVERLIAVGLPTLLLNAVGWTLHHRGGRLNAAVFLSSGTLLMPLLVATFLGEATLAQFRQPMAVELLRVDDLRRFAPTNAQIAISLYVLLCYSAFTLTRAHARILSIWTGIAWYLFYASVLLACGMKRLIAEEHVALVLVASLPAPLAFVYVAHRTRSLADGAWSTIFFVGFPIPFVILVGLLAHFAAKEWFHSGGELDSVKLQILLMMTAPVFAAAAYLCRRGWSSAVRFWSPFFLGLVGLAIIAPAHVAFGEFPLFELGDLVGTSAANGLTAGPPPDRVAHAVTAFEIIALVAPLALAAVGATLRLGTLVLPAVLGFAAFLLHFTQRHFAHPDDLNWARDLTIVSITAMVLSTAFIVWRGRRRDVRAQSTDRVPEHAAPAVSLE